MARGCHGRFKIAENKKKNWKGAAKDRRIGETCLRRRKSAKGCSAK
jgi:hypothetical protein